jgi:hypothetical protein
MVCKSRSHWKKMSFQTEKKYFSTLFSTGWCTMKIAGILCDKKIVQKPWKNSLTFSTPSIMKQKPKNNNLKLCWINLWKIKSNYCLNSKCTKRSTIRSVKNLIKSKVFKALSCKLKCWEALVKESNCFWKKWSTSKTESSSNKKFMNKQSLSTRKWNLRLRRN